MVSGSSSRSGVVLTKCYDISPRGGAQLRQGSGPAPARPFCYHLHLGFSTPRLLLTDTQSDTNYYLLPHPVDRGGIKNKILILNSSKHVQFDTPQSVGLILQPPLLLSIKLALPRPRNNHFPSSNTENRTSFLFKNLKHWIKILALCMLQSLLFFVCLNMCNLAAIMNF